VTPTAKISRAEASRRAHHAELLLLAAYTMRNYGRPELGDELCHLASQVADGTLVFDPLAVNR
jgi:hypothetical protein